MKDVDRHSKQTLLCLGCAPEHSQPLLMDFLPGLIHGAIELMFLDPLPSILLDWTPFQFGLTFFRVEQRL